MTLRHVAVFRFTEPSAPTAAALTAALRALQPLVPELRDYRFGSDAGLVEGNWDYAVVAELDDEAAFRAYQEHPEHQRILAEIVRPHLAARAAVQMWVEELS